VMVSGPAGMDGAIIQKPQYSFTIAGTERIATELSADYAELLARMVSQLVSEPQARLCFSLRGRAM
jgi:hypothetical protein